MITTQRSPINGPNRNWLTGFVNRNRSGTYTHETNFSMGFRNIFSVILAFLLFDDPFASKTKQPCDSDNFVPARQRTETKNIIYKTYQLK